MNQKENLERELTKYNYFRGVLVTFIGLAFFFSFLSLMSIIFVPLVILLLVGVLLISNELGKIKIKWVAHYK